MKTHIIFPNFYRTYSGGSSFLTVLRQQWRKKDLYSETIKAADNILFNSHHGLWRVLLARLLYPTKVFIHRIDGPMAAYNPGDKRDELVNLANTHLADGTIFQSAWSQQENHRRGLPKNEYETVILNAADPLFQPTLLRHRGKERIKLLSVSWSPHSNKGFADLAWLDTHLDFTRYDMTFVGNSPITFKNIHHIPATAKPELVQYMQQADIFIFSSRVEACSNTLLEALACKLPVIAYNATSNREIVGHGGELYSKPEQIIQLAEQITKRYKEYQQRIPIFSITDVALKYSDFIERVREGSPAQSRKFKDILSCALALAARRYF